MRPPLSALVLVVLVLGCTGAPVQTPGLISCQPLGYTPAPIEFSFAPGPVTSSAAETIAAAVFRACQIPGSDISDLTLSSAAGTGTTTGPNAGQAVWEVRVDATVKDGSPNSTHRSHFLIEVNQASGMPTVIAYG